MNKVRSIMKRRNRMIRLIIGLFLSFGILSNSQAQADRKKALLIAVADYPEAGGWNSLSSMNDLNLVTKTLLNQGFKEENILTLTNDKAVKKSILKAIQVDLLNKINPGDIVYFQFSGHGQQAADKSGDEIDGLDECIVPYDSPKKFNPGVYEGENLITDDELGQALTKVQEKLGPEGHVVVVLDACHSGTGTRGIAQARGTTEIMASPDYIKQQQNKILKKENNEMAPKARGGSAVKAASMVSFFGSAQNQLNYEMTDDEGHHYGSLSYAISSSLSTLNSGSSYRTLFDKIRNQMSRIAPLQQPQVEGELDMDVFNGKMLGKASYYRCLKVVSETQIIINGGSLQGINKGTLVGFYPADTRDFENAKAYTTGKVTKSYPTQSTVTLDSPAVKEQLESSWVYVTEASLGDIAIPVGMKIRDSNAIHKIEPWLYAKPFIQKDNENAKLWFYLEPSGPKSQLKLKSSDDYAIDSAVVDMQSEIAVLTRKKFIKAIQNYLQGQILKKMEMESPEIKVSFRIVPEDSLIEGMPVDSIKGLSFDQSGAKVLTESTVIQIMVINEGIKPAYFNLIDLQPDNVFRVLLPDENTTPEEMKVLPNQRILLRNKFEIGKPYGQEMFKLIASAKPMDLRSSLGTRGFKEMNPFEKVFLEMKDEETYHTRGGSPLGLPATEINIYTETFKISE